MFMWFWGGGVGHLRTRYLDSSLKKANLNSIDEQQDEETVTGMYEDFNAHVHNEWDDGGEEDLVINKDQDEGKGKNEDEDENNEWEALGDVDSEQDLDDDLDDEDQEILEEEGFAELRLERQHTVAKWALGYVAVGDSEGKV